MTQQQAINLTNFLAGWMRATIPGLQALRVGGGLVHVRDALGWRVVGTVADYAQVARALGRL